MRNAAANVWNATRLLLVRSARQTIFYLKAVVLRTVQLDTTKTLKPASAYHAKSGAKIVPPQPLALSALMAISSQEPVVNSAPSTA